jgi:hypothetical protein
MAKMIISENRLQELINESIYEVLNEWEWLDKVASKVGDIHQGVLNGINNAKNKYWAARDFKRAENRTTDPYAQYYDSANTFTFNGKTVNGSEEFGDMIRSQGGRRDTYRQDRINYLGGKFSQSRQNYENSSNFIGVSPHPGLAQNTQNTQNTQNAQNTQNNQNKKKRRKKKKNNGQQQGGQQPVQPQGGQQQPVQP